MWRANRKDFTMKHARWPPIDEFLCQKPLLGHHDFQLMGVQSVRDSGFIYFLFTHCCATGRKKETSSFWNFMPHGFPKCHRRAQLDPLGGAQATLRSKGVRACFTGDKFISGALKPVFFSSAWIIKEVTSLNWNHNVVTWSMELQSKKCEISPTLKYYLGGPHLRVNFERWSADIMRGLVSDYKITWNNLMYSKQLRQCEGWVARNRYWKYSAKKNIPSKHLPASWAPMNSIYTTFSN